jgi:hypothetical protein
VNTVDAVAPYWLTKTYQPPVTIVVRRTREGVVGGQVGRSTGVTFFGVDTKDLRESFELSPMGSSSRLAGSPVLSPQQASGYMPYDLLYVPAALSSWSQRV